MRPLLSALALALALSAGCRAPRYQPPAPHEPHALLKVRAAYHMLSGPNLSQSVTIGKFRLAGARTAAIPNWTTAQRIHAQPAVLGMHAHFFHTQTQTRRVAYNETERYACGTQRSGYGKSSYTTTRYCTRMRTKYRTETHVVTITDGACRRGFRLNPAPGANYILEFSYMGHETCTLTCYEQHHDPAVAGSFQLTPCPSWVPAPAE